nr:hypothetical protein BaRGS_034610 [Batillaria attramentaria]
MVYLKALKEKYRWRELQKLAFAERENLVRPVWVCYGHQTQCKVCVVDCKEGTMTDLSIQLSSRVMSLCAIPDAMLFGTLAWNIVCYRETDRTFVWEQQLHDAVLSICQFEDSSGCRVFAGLADGTLAVLEDDEAYFQQGTHHLHPSLDYSVWVRQLYRSQQESDDDHVRMSCLVLSTTSTLVNNSCESVSHNPGSDPNTTFTTTTTPAAHNTSEDGEAGGRGRRVVPESVKAVNHSEHDKDTARRSSPSSMNGVSKFYIGDERQKKVKKMMNGSVPVDANGNNKQSGRFICG